MYTGFLSELIAWLSVHSPKKCSRCAWATGAEFEGEGILAVTKALLQSGVGYVGGYQGAPISHLMDVLADAERHSRASSASASNPRRAKATAAAMLAASVNYPIRGAVTWKSTVGTNVASDALVQPGLRRRDRRRAHCAGRGLRRRRQHHAGAHARLRHEIPDVAARSAAESAVDRASRGAGLRAFRRRATRRSC